ncbi:helix-turn-helix transcriptional regulator [Methylobacterium planeticum]|uniref:Helix-turn-helix transcriptional regulator n=1 Tax=Methylobacterium planeticum TaxID=2615211 RepID=A0A6N6MKK3_9HYPH|nr:helix-turn-helix transcriptional regulator [Methylobacterium planeticum]KAB1070514.1 helix-turn-helix transcriptional regulator [Methylobacterium planeticum]
MSDARRARTIWLFSRPGPWRGRAPSCRWRTRRPSDRGRAVGGGAEPAQVFGLTGAEARLLIGLVEGRSLAAFAAGSGISVQTARFPLKRVFDKTGARRRSDLIRPVLTNPVVVRARDAGTRGAARAHRP